MTIKATYIDHMGSDLSVVNAARVSFAKTSDWITSTVPTNGPPERTLKHGDRKLIQYLAKHQHISPFGHAFASFHVKAPVFVARQLVKHSYLRWNEVSRRYIDSEPEFYMPDVWRGRSADKKQGSEGVVELEEYTLETSDYYHWTAESLGLQVYSELIEQGVAPEQARMVLPQSMMTEWYWSGSLDAFARMCNLRCKPDAQYESRLVADQISKVMGELFPVSWEALMENEDE